MLPSAFLGSSREGLRYAQVIAESLKHQFDVTLWKKPGTFEPSNFTLESLLISAERFDYGIFVMTADDLARIRKKAVSVSRDNVIFEAGLFFGALGRTNCFLFVSRVKNLHLPTDLKGLTNIFFTERRGQRLQAKQLRKLMEGSCNELRDHHKRSDKWGLNGIWRQTWFVTKSANFPRKNASPAEVAIFGSRFRAKFDVKGNRYQLIARINENRTITGFGSGPNKHSYHGSCQLVVSPDSRSLSGKWVGFRADNRVESGRWEWSRS